MPGRDLKNRVRIRLCGLLIESGSILLVQIHSPVTDSLLWMPPGGELEFGESIEACLAREIKEETGLRISVGKLAFVNELISPPYHAIECYYHVKKKGGELRLGEDPERDVDEQLLRDIRWAGLDELGDLECAPEKLEHYLYSLST